MNLPISVIVPFSKDRDAFFYRFCLPSIESNNPAEIIIESDEDKAPVKRNRGAKKATQPYLFFCDDDTILAKDCLPRMLTLLEETKLQFCYCNYFGIVLDEKSHPIGKNYIQISKPFSYDLLRKHNYIDTMSLLQAAAFPGFDEELEGYQDWDLWLTIVEQGGKGAYIDDLLYLTFHLGAGISNNIEALKRARKKIRHKHMLDN